MKFLQAVYFPGLQALSLVINHFDEDTDGNDSFDELDIDEEEEIPVWRLSLHSCLELVLSSATDRFPELSKLTINSKVYDDWNYSIPFQYLPNLQHLEIFEKGTPCYDTSSSQATLFVPTLEVLKIQLCQKN